MQQYTRTLVEKETNLSAMIEQAIKQNLKEDEDAEKNAELDIIDDADFNIEQIEKDLNDRDVEDFSEFLDNDFELDLNAFEDRED